MDVEKEESANSAEENGNKASSKNRHMIMRKRGRPRKCVGKDHEKHQYDNNNDDLQKESDGWRHLKAADGAEESISSLIKEEVLDFEEPAAAVHTKRLRPRKGTPRRAAV